MRYCAILYVTKYSIRREEDEKEICVFGESYTTEELWFDDEMNPFSMKQYHWGVIDDEEHYDGENVTDTFSALKKMISYNKLHEVLQYDNELQVEHDLDAVLSTMTQKTNMQL